MTAVTLRGWFLTDPKTLTHYSRNHAIPIFISGGREGKKETLTMPKKLSTNTKAEAARARKTATESEKKDKAAREKEEQFWKEAEGPKSRAAKKRDEEAEKRAEAAAKKAEKKRLEELEQAELEKAARKPDKKANRVSIPSSSSKVTEAELEKRREEERLRLLRNAEEAKKREKRMADEEEYERIVLVSNTNREEDVIEARSVEDAIARMAVVAESPLPADRHPERRLKATFKAFEEAELPKLKEEKPGLTLTQYKDMIWKLWKKSPDNPLNQVAE
ncbi:putative coiled-coil domain-containing protein 124-like [Iris pallida]|uniref:Coiled-coil domain-containing protein 124-like n=1 Tax=Iris pallida TaxID=29817 RepID=A0AAX6HIC6_IRIPA|nr:putative coiled-coil domain-containing protein 124-like [Iris pallida]